MDDLDLTDLDRRMEGALTSLSKEFQGLRTGRASTQLLDSVTVEAYGTSMPISQIATVVFRGQGSWRVKYWVKKIN